MQYLCYFGLFFSFGPIYIRAIISPFGYTEAQLILQIWSHKIHFLTLERFVANYSPRFLISIPPWRLSVEIQGQSYFPQEKEELSNAKFLSVRPFFWGASLCILLLLPLLLGYLTLYPAFAHFLGQKNKTMSK